MQEVLTLIIPAELFDFIKLAYSKFDRSHGVEHVIQVLKYANEIVAREEIMMTHAERNEFPYVMLCHDILDHKYVDLCLESSAVKMFYIEHLGTHSAAKVIHIHKNCSWSKRATNVPLGEGDWMRKVLEDADRLDALGENGLRRCIEYNEHAHANATSAHIQQLVCKHIREKLLILYDNFNFETSRKIVLQSDMMRPILKYLDEYESAAPCE